MIIPHKSSKIAYLHTPIFLIKVLKLNKICLLTKIKTVVDN